MLHGDRSFAFGTSLRLLLTGRVLALSAGVKGAYLRVGAVMVVEGGLEDFLSRSLADFLV